MTVRRSATEAEGRRPSHGSGSLARIRSPRPRNVSVLWTVVLPGASPWGACLPLRALYRTGGRTAPGLCDALADVSSSRVSPQRQACRERSGRPGRPHGGGGIEQSLQALLWRGSGTYRRRTAPEEGAAGGGVLHCTPRGVPGVMAGTLTPPKMDVPRPPSTPRACAMVLAATPLPLLSPALACVCRRRGVKAPCRIL
jgi:hypothetical protein